MKMPEHNRRDFRAAWFRQVRIFDFAFQPEIERARIETLATGAWIRNSEN
jgi:hypothetical protein